MRRGQLAQVGGPRAGLGMQLRRQLDRGGRHLERRLHRVERRDEKWKPNRGERQGVEGDCLETLGRGGAGDGDDTAGDPAREAGVVAEVVCLGGKGGWVGKVRTGATPSRSYHPMDWPPFPSPGHWGRAMEAG
eukprot:scaffold43655_cov51-Phaeocystis_antarctica.AAC.5